MTITVPNNWTWTFGYVDAQVQTLPTSGSWMIAVVAWRCLDGSTPVTTVGDLARNLWRLAGTSTYVASSLNVQVWVCPKAMFDGWSTLNVHASVMDISAFDLGSADITVFEVQGLSDAFTVDSVTVATAAAATTFSMAVPAPAGAANCLMVAAVAVDNAAPTLSFTAAGWGPLPTVSNTNPDVVIATSWRASTTAQTPAWSSTAAVNWAGVVVSIRETGVAVPQPNPNYPAVRTFLGVGYDPSTPLQAVPMTQVLGQHISTAHMRGIQAELGNAQSEQTDLIFTDVYGALAARASITGALSAAGTTTTAKLLDAQAAGLVRADWFQLRTAAGALKEPTIFQITSPPVSAAGTTTVTFTPAAQAATAAGDTLTTTPVDTYTPYRVEATWAGKTYPVCAGWLETYKTTWPTISYGLVDATAVDALAMLSVDSLSALRGEILRRSPSHYWPLDDPSGAASAQNVSGVSQVQLVKTPSKFGIAAATSDFGASTQQVATGRTDNIRTSSLVGDAASGWQVTGLVSADLPTRGFALVGADTAFPPIAGGVTIAGWTMNNDTDMGSIDFNSTVDPTVLILRNDDPAAGIGQGSVIKLSFVHVLTNFLNAAVTVWDQGTHAATTVQSTIGPQLVGYDFRMWALVFDRTSWAAYSAGNLVASGTCNLVPTFSIIDVGGEADKFAHTRFFSAIHCHVAVYPRKLSTQELVNLSVSSHDGTLNSETSDRRVQRLLATSGWKGARITSQSALTPAAEGTDTATVADKCAEVAGYEDGLFFADAAGQVQFQSRQQFYQQSVRAVLGEDTAGGEVPYTRDLEVDLDPTFIYNIIKIYNLIAAWVNSTTTTSVVTDPTSITKYQGRTFERTVRLLNIADGFALACWLVARYAYPQRRVTQLTIDAGAYPPAFGFVLAVEVGDLVTVKRRPIYEPATSRDYRVLQVAHAQEGAGKWLTTLTLAIAPPSPIILGDPVKSVIGNHAMPA